jgi:hypothetical protein
MVFEIAITYPFRSDFGTPGKYEMALYHLIFPFSIISGYDQNHKTRPGEPAELLFLIEVLFPTLVFAGGGEYRLKIND